MILKPEPGARRPNAIIFDWDSTLVDNWSAIALALNATLTAFGHAPWDNDEVRRRTKKSMRESFPELFGDLWEEAAETFYKRFEEFHLDVVKPMPGAIEIMDLAAGQGVPLAIVSNKNGEYLRREVAHLDWEHRFYRIIGATDAPVDKPAADPVHMALAESGVDVGEDVWFVGDSMVDLQCAHASGCTAVLVETGHITPEELDLWPPAIRAKSCSELAERLR